MMLLGPIGFLQPLILTALIALPLLWWLLRLIPPRPQQVWFPPLRLLFHLKAQEQTSHHTPWWLLLLRLLLVALVIIALANPVLNPKQLSQTQSAQAIVVVLDNSWAAAKDWERRMQTLETVVAQAEQNSQSVLVLPTAEDYTLQIKRDRLIFEPANFVKEKLAGFQPQPFKPSREATRNLLDEILARPVNADVRQALDVVWLHDGLDYGYAEQMGTDLARLVGDQGEFQIFRNPQTNILGSFAKSESSAQLKVGLIRSTSGAVQEGQVYAYDGRSRRLGETGFRFDAPAVQTEAAFNLPLELRNQVTRLEIAGETSAGAVALLDSRSKRQRVGLISGASVDTSQPLLSPLYYIDRALQPYSDIMTAKETNIAKATEELLEQKASIMIMADIGRLLNQTERRLSQWVDEGGILIRFAGPRMAQRSDRLLPVTLRQGGRVLGGALSWSTPQTLADFERSSPFYGLEITDEISVTRQVLADPTRSVLDNVVWARLSDGTPLVTAQQRQKGWVVLFHITANPNWSNLPLSGVFVEMLRRLSDLSKLSPQVAPQATSQAASQSIDQNVQGQTGNTTANSNIQALVQKDFLNPFQVLNGFGQLVEPASVVKPLNPNDMMTISPNPSNPPGFYGPLERTRALNLITQKTRLLLDRSEPAGATFLQYEAPKTVLLQPWLLFAALALFLIDALIILLMGLRTGGAMLSGSFKKASSTAALLIGLCVIMLLAGHPAFAQSQAPNTLSTEGQATEGQKTERQRADKDYRFALQSSLETRLAYVITGDDEVDRISRYGLAGLSRVLAARTAVEPADPIGVDITDDELVFFPFLYWPVLEDATALNDDTLAKIDAYMKHGGMILFDTRDYQNTIEVETLGDSAGTQALQRLIGKLNIPQLEPVPDGHVLTKSFYLLRNFPGRWESGVLWVESQSGQNELQTKQARRSDGVSSVLITSNDFAGAWALDETNRPLKPVVPGGEFQREMSFRTGINIIMYALTGNYKADQVHVPDLLRRLGQ